MLSCQSTDKVFIGIAIDLKDKFGLNKGQIIHVAKQTEFICLWKRLEKYLSLFKCYFFVFNSKGITLRHLTISYLYQLFATFTTFLGVLFRFLMCMGLL